MADVNRGQLLVVAALLLAVLFVGLAIVLNTSIYAENLASRATGDGTGETLEVRGWMNETVAQTIDRTNANFSTTDYDSVETALSLAIDNESRALGEDGAKYGRVAHLSRTETHRGTRLRQTNASRNFSDMNGRSHWNLTEQGTEPGQFTMQIAADSLYSATFDTTMAALAESAFNVEFHLEDQTGYSDGTWRIFFFQGAATNSIYTVVEGPNQNFTDFDDPANPDHLVDGFLGQSCAMEGDVITLRLGDSQYGGFHCGQYEFYSDLEPHRVSFRHVRDDNLWGGDDRGKGTYDILLNDSVYNDSPQAFHDPSGDEQPFRQEAVFSQDVSLTYRVGGSTFTVVNHTVVPMFHDPGGVLWEFPHVERFEVTKLSDSPAEFEIDWAVYDEYAGLDTVELQLVDKTATTTDALDNTINTNETVDSVSIDVDGPDDSGIDTLSHSHGNSMNEYRIIIWVTDESGRTSYAGRDAEADP